MAFDFYARPSSTQSKVFSQLLFQLMNIDDSKGKEEKKDKGASITRKVASMSRQGALKR